MFIFAAGCVCIVCVYCVCVYVCVCTLDRRSTLLLLDLGTEPKQPHSWERRKLLGAGTESHLMWLPLTCTASQSTGDKRIARWLTQGTQLLHCVSHGHDILTSVTWT